ncbi:MAG: hypothetical protein ACRD4E_12470, partial [Bryobacteraceae bacterium]
CVRAYRMAKFQVLLKPPLDPSSTAAESDAGRPCEVANASVGFRLIKTSRRRSIVGTHTVGGIYGFRHY